MILATIDEVAVQADLSLLLRIQEKDVEIRSLERERRRAPEALNVTKEKVVQTDNVAKQKHEELNRLRVGRKDLEVDLDSKMEQIKKYQAQLFQIKTNEEYKALQKEINNLKFAAGLQEDKILEKMEEIEWVQGEVKRLAEELNRVRDELKQREKEVAAELESIDSRMRKVRRDREALASGVPEALLARYNQIFDNKPDAAVVPILNNACRGCHMMLPPNVVNEVRKDHELIICDNCARILYLPGEGL